MKKTFKGFHNITQPELENIWKNNKTLFVFDTNVLLNLYGYAIQTRDDFFRIMDSISNNLWIPYHVGLEYQRRRLTVVKNEKSIFNDVDSNLSKIQNVFKGDFEKLALKRRFPKLFENTEKLEKEINKSINSYKKSVLHWNNQQPCVRSHDSIRDRINNLFEGKVGHKPEDQTWLDNLYKEGADRFVKKIPPGFKDFDKSKKEEETHFYYDGLNYERQYGDLIIWKQLIEKANENDIENVIFVTDDAKDDWWYKINSNGNKVVGPLAELQAEIYSKSNITAFHMYSTSMFMEDGKAYMAVDVDKNSIIDAKTSNVDRKLHFKFRTVASAGSNLENLYTNSKYGGAISSYWDSIEKSNNNRFFPKSKRGISQPTSISEYIDMLNKIEIQKQHDHDIAKELRLDEHGSRIMALYEYFNIRNDLNKNNDLDKLLERLDEVVGDIDENNLNNENDENDENDEDDDGEFA
jgi:hypothetical protein